MASMDKTPKLLLHLSAHQWNDAVQKNTLLPKRSTMNTQRVKVAGWEVAGFVLCYLLNHMYKELEITLLFFIARQYMGRAGKGPGWAMLRICTDTAKALTNATPPDPDPVYVHFGPLWHLRPHVSIRNVHTSPE